MTQTFTRCIILQTLLCTALKSLDGVSVLVSRLGGWGTGPWQRLLHDVRVIRGPKTSKQRINTYAITSLPPLE